MQTTTLPGIARLLVASTGIPRLHGSRGLELLSRGEMVLQRVLAEVHSRLGSFYTGSAPALQDSTIDLERPGDILKTMISDICDSMPFVIGDVDAVGHPTSSHGQDGTGLKAIE